MTESKAPQGVMDKSYAADRKKKPHLVFRYKTRARIVLRALGKHLGVSPGLRGLDFGSAEGRTLLELDALLPEATLLGIEYAEELIAYAPPLPPNVRLVQGDIAHLDDSVAEQAPFDFVSALAVLEHLPDAVQAVREAARVLKPGGVFVATCPNPRWDALATRLGLLAGEFHEEQMDKARLSAAVRDGGLEVVEFLPFMWAPVGLLPYAKVPVSASLGLYVDALVHAVRVLDWGLVNQCVVGRNG